MLQQIPYASLYAPCQRAVCFVFYGIAPEVKLLSYRIYASSSIQDIVKLFSKVVLSIYIFTAMFESNYSKSSVMVGTIGLKIYPSHCGK